MIHIANHPSRGLTLIELLVVVSLGSMVLLAGGAIALPWVADPPEMRESLHTAESMLQLARIEAVRRDQPCRWVLDPNGWTVQVHDTAGTSDTHDDELLYAGSLPAQIKFSRPDGGLPISLPRLETGAFQIVFTPRGSIPSGPAELVMEGQDGFGRLRLSARGDIALDYWQNDRWRSPS